MQYEQANGWHNQISWISNETPQMVKPLIDCSNTLVLS